MIETSAWEMAHKQGRRAFYERSTDTIRLCPENYCLAVRKRDRKWHTYRDEGATRDKHSAIQAILNAWQDGSTGDALADEIGKLF